MKYNNPALQQESIGEPAAIIAPRENESLFMWIKSTGRFMPQKLDAIYDEKKSNDELEDILGQEESDADDADE